MRKGLLAIFLFSFLGVSVVAQPEKTSERLSKAESADKREVERFVDRFASLMDAEQDVRKLPSEFFVSNYEESLATDGLRQVEFRGGDGVGMTQDELVRYSAAIQNLVYLTLLWNAGSDDFVFARDEKDEESPEFADVVPKDVCDALKRSPIAAQVLGLETDDLEEIDNPTPTDIMEAAIALEDAARLLRLALSNRDGSWKSTYNKNIATARMKFAFFSSEKCTGSFCAALPVETEVFYVGVFPFCVHIIREDGNLKIYQIHTAGDE